MFSIMTMEASSVMPIPIISPVMVIRFSVKPKIVIDIRVSSMEIGIESPIITVAFMLRKNKRSITIARRPP